AFSRDFKVVVHEKIYDFNRKYEELGVDLGEYLSCSEFDGRDDYLLIIPPRVKDERLNFLKDYSKALVSGWAVHGGAKYRYRADEAFTFSNHSDFESLVSYVEKASPQAVYTVHGFANEFSSELNTMGFYSQPLKKVCNGMQKSLTAFM
ncbi:MAG: MBL fold metallo-hydrolase RNA specificity domain-containing protein, partial [Candidatus Hydrothermarchaeales archaeon]